MLKLVSSPIFHPNTGKPQVSDTHATRLGKAQPRLSGSLGQVYELPGLIGQHLLPALSLEDREALLTDHSLNNLASRANASFNLKSKTVKLKSGSKEMFRPCRRMLCDSSYSTFATAANTTRWETLSTPSQVCLANQKLINTCGCTGKQRQANMETFFPFTRQL